MSIANGVMVALLNRGASSDTSLWPNTWPVALQVLVAVAAGDLLTYWIHRAAHSGFLGLWRFHRIHHSAHRLYWLNAGRAHPMESVVMVTASVLPAMLLGAPTETLVALTTFLNVNSVLRHSNADARLGSLNFVFSMAEGHRWHHSADSSEARNYGVNLLIWDHLFGTFHLPAGAPERLGLADEAEVLSGWLEQLALPFRSQ